MKITEPGLYPDLNERDYHAQLDWLSVSGAKKLLSPSCPAKFKAGLGREEEHKPQYDMGKAVHSLTLGDGPEPIVVQVEQSVDDETVQVDADGYRTKAAKARRDEIYAAGQIPLLREEFEAAEAMAAAVHADALAAPLLSTSGRAEQSLFWVDPATGVKCKARLDWLPEKPEGRRMIVPDLKTAESAEPGTFSRAAARFHYAMQDGWYCDGVRALGLDNDPAFVFIVVEKEDPWIVEVGQLTDDDKKFGAAMNDKARRIYAECLASNHWPTYSDGRVAELSLPVWHRMSYEEEIYS